MEEFLTLGSRGLYNENVEAGTIQPRAYQVSTQLQDPSHCPSENEHNSSWLSLYLTSFSTLVS